MINRTIVVPVINVQLARTLAATLSAAGVGMFETGCLTDGVLTHYISSGLIDAAFDNILPLEGSDQVTKDLARDNLFVTAAGLLTIEQCQSLVDSTIVVDCDLESGISTLARLGLILQ